MARKAVQISCSTSEECDLLVALCDDATIWVRPLTYKAAQPGRPKIPYPNGMEWAQVDPIPQESTPTEGTTDGQEDEG